MRHRTLTSLSIAFALAASISVARDASACGACFAPPNENTVVSGHRMVLALSSQQTTLYDQIRYSGDPSSFAWVLPVHGLVTIGLSAELMFQTLDTDTSVVVEPPAYTCPSPPPGCYPPMGAADAGALMDASGGGVTVTSQQTVGPYETVQLSSSDPTALATWLTDHGYAIPADMQPVIAAYVNEGFDFLALKLVPGKGIEAMRPVRVTTPGAAPTLPLRMVAGGTGASVPITLWVVAEGAYETTNFPTFRIDRTELVWDWSAMSSNYASLRQTGYQATNGEGWLEESSIAFSPYAFQSEVSSYVQMGNHDYDDEAADPDGGSAAALANLQADLDTLFAGMQPTSVRVTRLRAELPRAALGVDLGLAAAADQTELARYVQVTNGVGTPPCPDYSWCGDGGSGGGAGGATKDGGAGLPGLAPNDESGDDGGCAVSSAGGGPGSDALSILAAALGLAIVRRSKRGRA